MKYGNTKILALAMTLILGATIALAGAMYAVAVYPVTEKEYERFDLKYPKNNMTLSYDSEARYLPGDETARLDADEATGGFLVKGKKFTYESRDLVVLDITNETAENYALTVKVTYLDKDETVLGKETQFFASFAHGYQKYFLFDPQLTLDHFVCELEFKEADWDCWRSQITVDPLGMSVDAPDPEELYEQWCIRNDSDKYAVVSFKGILFIGSDGEIYSIAKHGDMDMPPRHETYMSDIIVSASSKEELVIPAELRDGYKAIAVIDKIYQYRE